MGLFKTQTVIVTSKKNSERVKSILLIPGDSEPRQAAPYTSTSTQPTTQASTSKEVEIENNKTTSSKHINFLENFSNWVVSPVLNNVYKNDIKIPAIHLRESRLLNSTLWDQVKYFAYILKSNTGESAEKIKAFAGEGNWLSEALNVAQKTVDSTFSVALSVLEGLNIETPDVGRLTTKDPFEGLYSPTPTGFEYTFPLYTQRMKNQTAGFSEGYSGEGKGLLHTLFDNEIYSVEKLAKKASSGGRALVEPGIYIEKTQFYNFGQNLDSINFSFPLLNTISQEQINQNYQFLFLLLYQNTMFRKDRAAFIPPCIYEVLVPGIRYMKFAHISRLKIDFLGTRRMIEVDPGISSGPFKTIVPEAYDVDIVINSLHEEDGNHIIRSAANSFEDIKIRDILP